MIISKITTQHVFFRAMMAKKEIRYEITKSIATIPHFARIVAILHR